MRNYYTQDHHRQDELRLAIVDTVNDARTHIVNLKSERRTIHFSQSKLKQNFVLL